MNYLSVCSGIEAASVAFECLGWTPVAFAEIEKFPSAVLAHHYPNVPNLGDMTKFHEWPDFKSTPIHLLVGGTPCQAFSVAGLREGLNDPRGNLTLTFLGVAAKYRPQYILWENVPGVLSDRTNAFGQFLAGLAELGYGWAYRVLDAQFHGLAQRRKRVFVVGYLGDWTRAAEILSLFESLLGNPPPSREARQDLAGTLSSRTSGGGGLGTDFDIAGGLQASTGGADENDAKDGRLIIGGGGDLKCADIAPTLNAHFGEKRGLENQHVDGGGGYLSSAVAGTLSARDNKSARMDADTNHLIPMRQGGFFDGPTHSLRGEGFDASEDGTGRGTPLVAIPILEPGARTGASTTDVRCGLGIGEDGDPMFTLSASKQHGVAVTAFSCKDSGADAGEISPTLRAMGRKLPNGGGQVAVAFHQNGSGELRAGDTAYTLNTNGNASGRNAPLVKTHMSVRRLTPEECEALQGFPRSWTDIPVGPKRKPAADGPRYKALGNSMAVPVMRSIGRSVAAVHAGTSAQVVEI